MILSLIAGFSSGDKPLPVADEVSKAVDCADPSGYNVVEVRDPGANYVKIERGCKVFGSIKLPSGIERNEFGFNWGRRRKRAL